VDPVLRNDQSLIFLADVNEQGVRALWLVPVRLQYAEVNRAVGEDLEQICARMCALSAEMGTCIERTDAALRVELPDGRAIQTWGGVGFPFLGGEVRQRGNRSPASGRGGVLQNGSADQPPRSGDRDGSRHDREALQNVR
jgi:hypothetical protein